MTIPNSNEWRSVRIDSLKPYNKRLRRHDRRKLEKLQKLIRHFGQVAPIVIDHDNIVLDGHAVIEAMRELGASEISVITVASRCPAELKALRLALNRLPAETSWDNQALRKEFEEIINLSFDLDLTAFDAAEIDQVLDLDLTPANGVKDEKAIPQLDVRPVSARGDLWICGDHRIGCGNSQDAGFIAKITGNTLADVAFADPLYNLPTAGFISGKSRNTHRKFIHRTGEMPADEIIPFFAGALSILKASCKPQALIYACTDWQRLSELLTASTQASLALHNLAVWVKTSVNIGTIYRNQYELVAVFQAGATEPMNNVKHGEHSRKRSNVWNYRDLNMFGNKLDQHVPEYTTVKPVALITDVLRDVTKQGDIVLDTFVGWGSTLIAAEDTGRRCFGTDVDPRYVDLAVKRWQNATEKQAVHAGTGERFSQRTERLAREIMPASTTRGMELLQEPSSEATGGR